MRLALLLLAGSSPLAACAGAAATEQTDAPLDPAALPSIEGSFEVDPRTPAKPRAGAAWIVAHPDDDLLFMNPDVDLAIDAGPSVTFVLTAGDAGAEDPYWHRRESGLRAAYARMAAVSDDWHLSTIQVAGHLLPVSSLTKRPDVRLVFFRLPDGGFDAKTGGGDGTPRHPHASLARLWSGAIPSLSTVDGRDTYTRDELTATLAVLLRRVTPRRIGVLEPTPHEFDRADHWASARFAVRAIRTIGAPQAWAYMGYPLFNAARGVSVPPNLDENQRWQKRRTFLAYCPFDRIACPPVGDYAEWLSRRVARPL